MEKKFYCKAPWTALFVHPNGGVKCCCSGLSDWGNLENQTIEEILSSEKVVELKKDIINGFHNPYCNTCREGERLSGTSQRSFFHNFTIPEKTLHDPYGFELYSLDIRWQNLCNLTCVYCRDEWSSGWQKIHGIPIRPAKVPYHENIINFIKQYNDTVEGIIIAGGEPLLHKQNIRLLEILPESVQVGFISNLSIDLKDNQVFKLLKNRKNVTWSISMEGLNDRFEYVRRGAKFEKMVENLYHIKENLHDNQSLFLFPVYCIFSIDNLVEFYQFAKKFNASLNWQHVINPSFMNPFRFNPKIIEYALEQVDTLLNDPIIQNLSYDDGFMAHTKKMLENLDCSTYSDIEFRKFIDEYETSLDKKFANVFPDIDNLILK